MAWKSSVLKVLVLVVVTSHVWSQHWSFGLSPGGKRELDGLSQTLSNHFPHLREGGRLSRVVPQIVGRFQHVDTPCRVVGCEEELAKMHRLKGFLENVADVDNGYRAFEK